MSVMIIVGGVHGVGKTTLLGNMLFNKPPGKAFVDPGALFVEHLYKKRDKTNDEIEQMVVAQICAKSHCADVVVASWHYAVWTPDGYVPQISIARWKLLVADFRPERLYLVNVAAPVREILKRRVQDYDNHPRKRDLGAICEEILKAKHYYRRFASEAAHLTRVVEVEVNNTGIDLALAQMDALYKEAYEIARTEE